MPPRGVAAGTPSSPYLGLYQQQPHSVNVAGSNQSSLLDFHNLSQDSGISPSPNMMMAYNNGASPVLVTASHAPPAGYLSRVKWKFGEGDDCGNPLPLPPRNRPTPSANVFQPTMRVKSPAIESGIGFGSMSTVMDSMEAANNNNALMSIGSSGAGTGNSWRSRMKQRTEAKRRSSGATYGRTESSSDENDASITSHVRMRNLSLERSTPVQIPHDLGIPVSNSPAPTARMGSRPDSVLSNPMHPPPPPPPRDPRRRLYLVKNDDGRPLSYSFENANNASPASTCRRGQMAPNSINDVGLPVASPSPSVAHLRPPASASPAHSLSSQFSSSEQNLSSWRSRQKQPLRQRQHRPPDPSPYLGQHYHQETPRSTRQLQHGLSVPPLGDNRYSSQPALNSLVGVRQNPSGEYWKSPPPGGLGAIPLHAYERARLVYGGGDYGDSPREASPQRPIRKKLSNCSSTGTGVSGDRDSVIQSCSSAASSSTGKSSPSSSISSKDSGCSEMALAASSKRNSNSSSNAGSRPLSAVIEAKESPSPPPQKAKTVVVVKEYSPPRSFADDPGFSTKKRRSHFQEALNELEDVFNGIQRDSDLLDRAERRDLPTAHQELIAQARERFQGEDTSRQDDDDGESSSAGIFSDMDNFMNWNTSSSFENVSAAVGSSSRPRSRTPCNRRSAVYDKKKDDVVYRICRDNNRPPPETSDPSVSRADQSYLEIMPKTPPKDSSQRKKLDLRKADDTDDEADAVADDLVYRARRDSKKANAIQDPQPKFGIPKGPIVPACSDKDYLHAVPDPSKYKSTFNAMKNPDPVLDDLGFRSWRKDGNLSDPGSLGIVKDPNTSHLVEHSSCWLHKRIEAEYKRDGDKGPCVFYPKKNQALLKSLSEHIAQIIKKQSASGSGGSGHDEIITYEDLRDPKVAEAMKYTLGVIEEDQSRAKSKKADDEEEDDPQDWSGKNVFELLSTNIVQLLEKKKQQKEEEQPETSGVGADPAETVIVQSCVLEHDLSEFNRSLSEQLRIAKSGGEKEEDEDDETRKKKVRPASAMDQLLDGIENAREREMGLERSESSCSARPDDHLGEKEKEKKEDPADDGVPLATLDEDVDATPAASGGKQLSEGESRHGVECLREHPLLLLACYLLAVAHQLTGLDFLTALGVICATLSMVSMWFI